MKQRKIIVGVQDVKDANGIWLASYMITTPEAYVQHQTRSYVLWRSMNDRLSVKYKTLHPTYEEARCLFSDYQSFAEWCQYQHGYMNRDTNGNYWSLDKDIIEIGNKNYSPDFCVFVPNRINKLLTTRDALRGEYPLGVSWDKGACKFAAACRDGKRSVRLGRYENPMDAHKAWQVAKISQLLNASKDECLSDIVKNALIRRADKIQGELDGGFETTMV